MLGYFRIEKRDAQDTVQQNKRDTAMKIIMSLIVATLLLLTSTIAIALEPAFHKFQKDEYGLLTSEDLRTFDQEYARAQSKGYIRVSFDVRHYGETRSND